MMLSRALRTLVGASAIVIASNANAQPPRRQPSPVLLKRLAEAMDGNRTGDSTFVVASYDSLSPVRGVFPTREAARALAATLGTSYDVFGPFTAPPDPPAGWFVAGCTHDGIMSIWNPPGPRGPIPLGGPVGAPGRCPERRIPLRDIAGMTLTVRLRDSTTQSFVLSRTVDAIFLTLPAIDKFVIPYYARIIGIDSAAAMRAAIANELRRP